jgi:hypothetical protein
VIPKTDGKKVFPDQELELARRSQFQDCSWITGNTDTSDDRSALLLTEI